MGWGGYLGPLCKETPSVEDVGVLHAVPFKHVLSMLLQQSTNALIQCDQIIMKKKNVQVGGPRLGRRQGRSPGEGCWCDLWCDGRRCNRAKGELSKHARDDLGLLDVLLINLLLLKFEKNHQTIDVTIYG